MNRTRDEGDRPAPRSQGWLELAAGLVIVIVGFAWLIGFTDRVVMPLVVHRGSERQVPDLHLMSYRTADSLCASQGLELVRGRIRIDDRRPVDSILDQHPVAGSSVKPGKRIEVVVSDRIGDVFCPALVGTSPRQSILISDSLGLVVDEGKLRYSHSNRYPEGVVMKQIPSSGITITPGDTVTLWVSLGSRPTDIRAPDLVGRRLDAVSVVLAKHSLRLGEIVRYPDRSAPSGTIISQDPAAGAAMKQGQRVSIRVAVTPK